MPWLDNCCCGRCCRCWLCLLELRVWLRLALVELPDDPVSVLASMVLLEGEKRRHVLPPDRALLLVEPPLLSPVCHPFFLCCCAGTVREDVGWRSYRGKPAREVEITRPPRPPHPGTSPSPIPPQPFAFPSHPDPTVYFVCAIDFVLDCFQRKLASAADPSPCRSGPPPRWLTQSQWPG